MKKYFVFLVTALCLGFVSCSDDENSENSENNDTKVPVLEDSTPSVVISSTGFYVANEDWFGHDYGTVNYFKNDGTIVYRAYRAANADATLGTTTQFATIYGDNVYFISKQDKRLVVADAKTMVKKAVFTDLKGGDGRSFLGVNEKLGYIGHSKGICQFDITNLQLGEAVAGITDQMGTLCYAEGRVFALAASKVHIINVKTNQVEKTLTGSFNTLTRSKDGTIWIAGANNFIKLNPKTLEETIMDYPGGVKVGSPWFAWNSGSLCASTQKNVLYWSKGSSWSSTGIVKYDIDTQVFNDNFYTFGKHENAQLTIYGAGLRIDPITDRVITTVTRGYENYNWIYIFNPDGTLEKEIDVKGGSDNVEDGYYWFPSVPFFEDPNAPEILVNQIRLAPERTKSVDLNQKIVDADNTSVSIIREVEFAENDLVASTFVDGVLTVTAKAKEGSTTCKVIAISNGKRVEKQVRVDVVKD